MYEKLDVNLHAVNIEGRTGAEGSRHEDVKRMVMSRNLDVNLHAMKPYGKSDAKLHPMEAHREPDVKFRAMSCR
jgi:hypothetical protein